MQVAGTISSGAAALEPFVRAMAAGDRAALSRIYEQTVSQTFAIARAILGSREDAEEIVCDVYTHAWRRAATYDPGRGTVMAWLAIMTRNRALDRLRQRREILSLSDEKYSNLAAAMTAEALGPEQLLTRVQVSSAVCRALQSLNPQRRLVIDLAFFKGMTHQEIADAIGMKLGTVKSHVRRALAALQSELAVDA